MTLVHNINLITRSLLFILVLFFSMLLKAQNKEQQKILDTFLNKEKVVYKTIDGQQLDMMIFYPDEKKIKSKNPWMMHVHGGGWAGGDKYKILRKPFLRTLQSLLEKGVICVSIEYRRAKGNINAYDAVVDSKDAARFLLKNSKKYKLHKKKYGVWGGSAGGHLSLLTALADNNFFEGDVKLLSCQPKFKCVVSYFPFTSCLNPDLRPGSVFEDGKTFIRLFGKPLDQAPILAELLSPTKHLQKNSPPVLLLHGDKDDVLPIINSIYMVEEAKHKGADVELLTIKNAGHSFNGSNISPSIEELNDYATNFILTHLN